MHRALLKAAYQELRASGVRRAFQVLQRAPSDLSRALSALGTTLSAPGTTLSATTCTGFNYSLRQQVHRVLLRTPSTPRIPSDKVL